MLGDVLHLLHIKLLERADTGGQFRSEEEVTPDRHEWNHGQILVHGGDTGIQRNAWTLELDGRTVQHKFTFVVLVKPGDDLDQRGLAGSVVAEHAGDLAWIHHHVHITQGDDAAIVLTNAFEGQQVVTCFGFELFEELFGLFVLSSLHHFVLGFLLAGFRAFFHHDVYNRGQ